MVPQSFVVPWPRRLPRISALPSSDHVVASACLAGGLYRAAPSYIRSPAAFRRAVAARNELLKMASDPDPIDKHVGNRIRLRRLDIGCSQTKLAKAVGVTFQQVQKYEKGTNRIAASRLYKLAKILGVPITFFFDGLERPKHRNSPHR